MVIHDVIVIGAGLAGMRASVELAEAGLDVAIVTKVHPIRSHSVAAQGGINAAMNKADSWKDHMYDTAKGSDFLGDQDAIEVLCKEAPENIKELERMGAIFNRDDKGNIAQRPFGGAGYARTCYLADRTGHSMLHIIFEQVVARGICRYNEWHVVEIIVEDGVARGVIAIELLTGKLHRLHAKAVLLATGGYGRVFSASTNALSSTGDGMSLALRAGAPLMDMEFVQFHPTTLKRTGILMTEGARGEGGYLINADGDRFMHKYAPNKLELASRDVVSRAEQEEIDAGFGDDGCVFLDLRHLGEKKISEKLPQIRDLAIKFEGVDPVTDPIPIKPGAHYSMGGIMTDIDGKTPIKGLFAAGESACLSVHGANRLGGNSLLEAVVFGRRVGRGVAKFAKTAKLYPFPEDALKNTAHGIALLMNREVGESASKIVDGVRKAMQSHCGIYRDKKSLEEGLTKVRQWAAMLDDIALVDTGDIFNTELINVLELGHIVEISEAMLLGALNREESRGSHSRTDFPTRDDENWLKHTLVYMEDGKFRVDYKGVSITRFQPEERKY